LKTVIRHPIREEMKKNHSTELNVVRLCLIKILK
jgi:hypothetical protein